MANQSVTLDVDEALQRLNGNRQLFVRLVSRFLELNRNVEEDVRKALDSKDSKEIFIFFHSLKGGASNLSAKRIANKSAELELLAKAGDIEGIKEELPGFLALFTELRIASEDLSAS